MRWVCRLCCSPQADVICLQEVDDKAFTEYLQPHLALLGYQGHYTSKEGKVRAITHQDAGPPC